MPDDVVLNKASAIERCLARVREEYAGDPASLDDLTRQDSIVLNLQRAAQGAIDLAMHLVRARGLGLPQQSRDAFLLLARDGGLPADLADRLVRMVGFRNVAVHDYQALHLGVVRAIVEERLGDFEAFTVWALTRR
jgi:uncharacterized protein YutE (UPF0331/DUF86 family)